MYKYPERKKYRYIIPTIKWNCELIFQQAVAEETQTYLEIVWLLMSKDVNDQIRWLQLQKEYFENFIDKFLSECPKNSKRYKVLSLVKEDLDEYKWAIGGMLHPIWKSMYDWTQVPTIDWKKQKDYPFDNHYEVIVKKTLIPIDQLYERLTMEQIGRYIDKIVYDAYETFKEGRAINLKLIQKWWLSEDQKRDLEIIRQNLHSQK